MNSKYTGNEVEQLLDQVSGKTIYTQGSGITISDTGEISCTVQGGGSGGDGVTQELYDSFQQATAKILFDQNNTNASLESKFSGYYTKQQTEDKFVDNSELESKLVDFLKSEAYHKIHDPQEKAISASLVKLDTRVTELESNSGSTDSVSYSGGTGISIEDGVISYTGESSSYDDTEVRQLISANTEAINSKQSAGDYALSANTYTKDEVNALVEAVNGLKKEVVGALPTEDIDINTIYLVHVDRTDENDVYDEYLYINSAWEKIGNTNVSLEGYATTEQLNGKANSAHTHTLSDITDYEAPQTLSAGTGIDITDGVISCTVEGGSGGSSDGYTKDEIDAFNEATAKLLYDQNKKDIELENTFKSYYDKAKIDSKFTNYVTSGQVTTVVSEYMKTSAYEEIHEPIEITIGNILCGILDRLAVLESYHTTNE